jgi:hypothetical protein
LRDLKIHVGGIDGKSLFLGHQVANVEKMRLVGGSVEGRTGMLVVPGIDPGLQFIAALKQCGVSRRQSPNESGESPPKGSLLDACAGHGFVVDEIVQVLVDSKVIHADGRSHSIFLGVVKSASLDEFRGQIIH